MKAWTKARIASVVRDQLTWLEKTARQTDEMYSHYQDQRSDMEDIENVVFFIY